MLAARLPSILPPLSPSELLEVSMIASVAGEIRDGALTARRPFRAPHHSASMAALTGGGMRAKPGEISLAHQGVLFLDELPEFDPRVLDSLRQPLENGEVAVSRANHRVTYPARFMLVAAMNPCRCGHAYEPGYSCKRGRINRCATPPRPCGCRHAAIIACCASPGRWPTSMAPTRSAGCIWPKPCPTARSPTTSGARPEASTALAAASARERDGNEFCLHSANHKSGVLRAFRWAGVSCCVSRFWLRPCR